MKKKVKQNYEQLALSTGLRLDEEGGALYGTHGEYSVLVYPANPSYPYILAVAISAARESGPLTGDEIKQFKNDNGPVTGLGQNGYVITMSLKGSKKQEVVRDNLVSGLNALTAFLRMHGYRSSCQTCGRDVKIAPRCVSGSYVLMCQDCYAQLQQNKTLVQAQISNMGGWNVGTMSVDGTGGTDFCYELQNNAYVMYPDMETVGAAVMANQDVQDGLNPTGDP